ncbi:hypothetical protein LguiA_002650 [Lonicera macranthoides]
MIEKLEVLEILSFAHSEIQDLPIEIRKLSRLRLLDLTGCSKLHRIPPSLLSSLIRLEELYLIGTSIYWAEQIHDDGGGSKMNASFAELKVLSNLLVIEIDIPYEVLPVDLIFLEKVKKFYICVGGTYEKDVKHVFQNTLCCMVDKSVVLEGAFHVLGKKTEVLYLKVKDLKNLQKELEREELLKVRDLELQSCDEMVSLVNTVGRQATNVFQNLESLCLSDMSKLKSIFPLSIASGLIKLKRLKVVRCQAMEELFTKEIGGEDMEAARTFVFRRIESLHLDNLPSLVGFCKAVDEIELPQLEDMELLRLPKITSIYSKTEDLAAECQHASSEQRFFKGKVKLNKMAGLKLVGMENLTEIRLPHNLRMLIVEDCDGLVNIFSSSIAMGSVMLERLTIDGCKMMDAIFWKERGEDEAAATTVAKIQFPHLKYLRLKSLPNLTHFCKSFEEVEFPQLEEAGLYKLPKLDGLASKGHLFDKKDLQNLQELSVKYCGSVEVIFDLQQSNVNEGGHELAVLARLKDVTLVTSNNMETQQVRELHNLKALFPTSVLTQLQNLEKLQIRRCSSLEVVFDHQGLNAIQLAGAFQYLNSLIVWGCDSLRHVLTPSIAKLLSQLQTLKISNCENLEAVVAEEEEEYIVEGGAGGGIFNLFPQLTSLSLEELPKLLQITPKAYTFNWPSLKELTLADCGKLTETLYDTLQVTSNNMETQQVRELHNPKALFPTSVLTQLQNFEKLAIRRCSSLEVVFDHQGLNAIQLAGALQYVFTPSIAKLLSRLQTLEISNCENLIALVAEEEEEYIVEGGAGGGIFILFPQLTSLSLKKLPKLLQITPKAYTFNWPSLKDLRLADCGKLTETLYDTLQVALPNMETLEVHKFDNIAIFFPTSVLLQLQHLRMLEIHRCCSLEVVFNLQEFNVNNEGRYELLAPLLTHLWRIDLCSLPKLRHVWKTGAHVIQGSFKNLSSLYVEHCDSLKYVFTPSVAKLLSALEYVKIVECENLEAIVAEEDREEECRLELGGGGGINVILFPQLTSLNLCELQNLLTIMPKPYTFDRSSLHVSGCDKLQDIQ